MERCVFNIENNQCSALIEKKCEKCRFYKTQDQLMDGRRRAEERLDSIKGGLRLYQKYSSDGSWCKR